MKTRLSTLVLLAAITLVLVVLSWAWVAAAPAFPNPASPPASETVLTTIADTMILSETADMNWGDWDNIQVGYDDYFGIERSLVQFDLSASFQS